MTTWSEHAKHYILTSDFDAALISETHLEREKLVIAAKEARKFSWAVLAVRRPALQATAQVREYSHWSAHVGFPSPCPYVVDEAGFLCPNPRLAGRVIRVSWVGRFCCLQLISSTPCRFPQRYQRQFDARRVFSHERRKASSHFGSRFQLPAKLVARPVHARRQSLASETGSISGHFPGGTTHTCCVGKGQKPDIIDYFLVSTLIRPLIQKCEIVKSVPWGPHPGVKLTLSIKFESVVSRQLIGKFSKRNRHNTNVLQGQSTQHTDSADPAIWNEARRNCVFEGKKPRCQDGLKLHALNMLTRVASWKRLMSWATLWRPGATLRINIG